MLTITLSARRRQCIAGAHIVAHHVLVRGINLGEDRDMDDYGAVATDPAGVPDNIIRLRRG